MQETMYKAIQNWRIFFKYSKLIDSTNKNFHFLKSFSYEKIKIE